MASRSFAIFLLTTLFVSASTSLNETDQIGMDAKVYNKKGDDLTFIEKAEREFNRLRDEFYKNLIIKSSGNCTSELKCGQGNPFVYFDCCETGDDCCPWVAPASLIFLVCFLAVCLCTCLCFCCCCGCCCGRCRLC